MRHPEGTRRIAKVISRLLHPYVCIPVVVAVIAYGASPNLGVWAKWTMAALLPAYLFPFLYMRAKVALVPETTGVTFHSFTQFFRDYPNKLSIGACLFGVPSVLILYVLRAKYRIIASFFFITG